MDPEFRESFAARHRRAIALGIPLVLVVVALLFYNVTKPMSSQSVNASGGKLAESEMLQVGALPVT